MGKLEDPEINVSHIRVAGLGGLGMIVVVAAMAYAMPAIRAFVLLSLAGGVLVATTFIAYRRWSRPAPPSRPTLMVDTSDEKTSEKPASVKIDSRSQLSPVASAK